MIEEMRERVASERDAKLGSVGEVGERLAPRGVILAEDQLAFRAFRRPPVRDAPLQGAQMAIAKAARMPTTEFLKQAGRPDVGYGLEQWREIVAPDLGKRIGTGAVASALALARQHRGGFGPPSRPLAEACARRRCGLAVALSS